jgi:aryl-alcohol dehydrogenase-like predicted oxidoreductase
MRRREFLKTATFAAGASIAATRFLGSLRAAQPEDTVRGDMRYRRLGRTGELVSLVGLGGHHIGRVKDEAEAIAVLRSAVDHGINFLDNCWDYHDGGSERLMGKALRDGYRDKVFLMTKIDGRTRAKAAKQIDECLARLRTDRIDLLQHHEVIRLEDGDRVFAEGGAHEAVLAAQKAGKIRFTGFTGHKDPLVHLRMLEVASAHGFRFDAVQLPLNVMDAHFRSFGAKVVPELVRQGIGVLGMKSMADGHILKTKLVTPIECLHYAMSLPTSTVITGIDSRAILDQALEAVRTFRPLSEDELAKLVTRTAEAARSGRFEPFKTTQQFDGTARRPDWLGD